MAAIVSRARARSGRESYGEATEVGPKVARPVSSLSGACGGYSAAPDEAMGGKLLRRTDHRTRLLRSGPRDLPAVMLALTASTVAVIFAAIVTSVVLHREGARSARAYEQESSTCHGGSLQELFADLSSPILTTSTLKYLYTTSVGSDRLTIDRRSHLSLEEYRETYDGKWPVVITDVVDQWNAAKWNREFFAHRYSSKPVFTKTSMNGKLSGVEGQLMPLSSFIGCCINSSSDSSTVVDDRRPHAKWMYVEDEHFVRCTPELLSDIGTCLYTEDDWFRLLLPADLRPWQAMLLWGSRGSRSSLHVDPYNWTGTLAVLSGRKRWKIFLPGQDELLQLSAHRSGFPLDVFSYTSPIDAFDEANPKWQQAVLRAKHLELEQKPGELLLIPSGWPHQAYNDEETMALSGQVMNANNYRAVLGEIFKSGYLKHDQRLPCNFHALPPSEQVSILASRLRWQQPTNSRDYCQPP